MGTKQTGKSSILKRQFAITASQSTQEIKILTLHKNRMELRENNSVVGRQNSSTADQLQLIDFQIVFLFITIIATVLGNALVLAAIFLDSRLRNVTNYFIACLAVSDLLVACFSVTIRLHQYLEFSKLNIHTCKFWNWIDIFCEAASITTLTVISIDRYYRISQPFYYREKMTKGVAMIIIISIWAYASLLATLGLIPYAGAKGVTLEDGKCKNSNKIFYTLAAVMAFFFPLAILIIMYTLIFRIALYHFRKTNAVTMVDTVTGKQLHYSAHKDLKATRTIFIVVSTFVVCWGPFFTLFLINQYQPSALKSSGNKTYTLLAVIFFILLPSANSFFNPIIYACFDKVYRRSFRKILLKLVGKTEYLASQEEYYGGPRATRVSRSVLELTVVQSGGSIPTSSRRPHGQKLCFAKKHNDGQENGKPSSPSMTQNTSGSKETDILVFDKS